MSNVAVSVIIVSYNTKEITLRCLRALFAELRGWEAEVFVVDNASRDGSPEAVRAEFPQVQLLAEDRNHGFGAANNLALARARGKYVLFLNSDAFLQPGALKTLCDYLENHSKVGLVGPKLLNADSSLQRSCYRFPSPWRSWLECLWISGLFADHHIIGDYRRWTHDTERRVEFVSGACMLARREVYERIGGFDERFFMYQEETDWQRRLTDAGYQVMFDPAAAVVHLGGHSGKDEVVRVKRQFMDSFDKYQRKHHGVIGLWSVRLALLLGCSFRALVCAVAMLVPSWRPRAALRARNYLNLALWQVSARLSF